MKTTRLSEAQIMGMLKHANSAVSVPQLCCDHRMSSALFYKWRAKYGGMDASMVFQMKSM